MKVTDEQIRAYLTANPGITDEGLYSVMTQYDVTPTDIHRVVGGNLGDYEARYTAQAPADAQDPRSEEHTSELQSPLS
jgi:hypothetical protein